jgi:hypothetical protein
MRLAGMIGIYQHASSVDKCFKACGIDLLINEACGDDSVDKCFKACGIDLLINEACGDDRDIPACVKC